MPPLCERKVKISICSALDMVIEFPCFFLMMQDHQSVFNRRTEDCCASIESCTTEEMNSIVLSCYFTIILERSKFRVVISVAIVTNSRKDGGGVSEANCRSLPCTGTG